MKHQKTSSLQLSAVDGIVRRLREFNPKLGVFDYAERGRAVAEAHQIYNDSVQLIKQFPRDSALSEACTEAGRLWLAALSAVYPPGFWEDIARLHTGDSSGLESAVAFLEANPYFHRSGYTKEKVIRALKSPLLTPEYSKRLGCAVLTIVDTRDGEHFRAFCRLARKVDAPALREQLTARLTSGDAGIRRRARWVLEALAQKDSQERAAERKGTRG